MNGERLARVSLAIDAVYSALMGLSIIAFHARLGGLLRLPGILVAAFGAAVVAWAYVVLAQTVRIDWRKGIVQTLTANAMVATLLALAAAFHPARGARVLLGFVALDAISLAVAEGISLIRGRTRD